MRNRFAFAAAVAASSFSLPAAAHDWDREWRSIRVDASAFDLAEPAGRTELARRIARAVNRICGTDYVCRDEAWASTEGQVGWAIERDIRIRVLAAEREAQLRACEWDTCLPSPEPQYGPPPEPDYAPPPEPEFAPPPPAQPSYYAPAPRRGTVTRVTVRVVHGAAAPTILTYCR